VTFPNREDWLGCYKYSMSRFSSFKVLFAMRLFTFAFAWAWSVVAGALGLFSLVKSNQEKASVKAAAAALSRTITVNIDTQGELPHFPLP
jgi:hypothetical protein